MKERGRDWSVTREEEGWPEAEYCGGGGTLGRESNFLIQKADNLAVVRGKILGLAGAK
jgi:hypothetical protein